MTSLLNTSAHLRLQNIAKLHIPWALPRQITACPFHRTCLVITLQYHKHLDDTDIQLFAVWRNAGLANPTQGITWTWSNFFKQPVKISQIYVQISPRNHCLWSFSRVDWFLEHSRAVFIHVSLFNVVLRISRAHSNFALALSYERMFLKILSEFKMAAFSRSCNMTSFCRKCAGIARRSWLRSPQVYFILGYLFYGCIYQT